MRVMCVDDEPTILSMLRRVLSDHEVECCHDAEEALSAVLSGQGATPDVIVCDLMMPGMSGQELYEALLRERPELARRVVFMTGLSTIPGTDEFLDSVPNVRLGKPFSLRDLKRAIAVVGSQ